MNRFPEPAPGAGWPRTLLAAALSLALDPARAATFTPASVADLISAIDTANANGEDDVIDLGGGTFTLTVADNTTEGPNGLPSIGSKLTIEHGTIQRDSTAAAFRIVHVAAGGDLTLKEVTVSGGAASGVGVAGVGGGVLNQGTLTLAHSTVSGNSGAGFGGGVHNFSGTLTLADSTVSGNSASNGGGVFNFGTGTLTHSTVSGNSASFGGGVRNFSGILTLAHSLIAGNTASTGAEIIYEGGTITANAHNLFGHGGLGNAQAFVNFTPGASDLVATSDGGTPTALGDILGPLADHGGPTPTHALPPGSPAVDAVPTADCDLPATDQRGVTRPQGPACDIGAFELEAAEDDPEDICAGSPPAGAIVGNDSRNVLIGTSGDDVIFGLGGNDLIFGLGGNDLLCGGDGHDLLFGGDGDDALVGGPGNDTLAGDEGADRLYGGPGHDALGGGEGADHLYGGEGDDLLGGDAGDDQLHGEAGNDALKGGDGADQLHGGVGRDLLDGKDKVSGNDSLDGGADSDLDACRADAGDTVANCP